MINEKWENRSGSPLHQAQLGQGHPESGDNYIYSHLTMNGGIGNLCHAAAVARAGIAVTAPVMEASNIQKGGRPSKFQYSVFIFL
jgi:hypothetical protein